MQQVLAEQWTRVRARLRAEVGEAAFRSWLKPLVLVSLREGVVRLSLPTRFMRDWVSSNYADRLRELWGEEMPSLRGLEVVVTPPQTRSQPVRPPAAAVPPSADAPGAAPVDEAEVCEPADGRRAAADAARLPPAPVLAEPSPVERGNEVSVPLDPRLTFEAFVVGKPNEFAYAAARRVVDAEQVPFNPLFLYGGVGLGKTHLMHSIAWGLRQSRPERRVVFISAEKFLYTFVRAIRTKDVMSFKELFRSVDVLMVDDLQSISGKDSTQEEFFHTFNALVDANKQIVISADKSPSDLEGMEERLRSRLGWGLVADIHPTTYELRLGILQSKCEAIGAAVPLKVLEFLAHRIVSNVRELEGALNRIVAHATLVNRPLTLETTQDVLRDLLRANDRRVTIDDIQKKVAEHFKVRQADMSSPRRARAVARPRQVAMYLCKQLTTKSLPEIGRKFGGRDHTTVMHAVRKVEELRAIDAAFAEDVDLLRRMLES